MKCKTLMEKLNFEGLKLEIEEGEDKTKVFLTSNLSGDRIGYFSDDNTEDAVLGLIVQSLSELAIYKGSDFESTPCIINVEV